MTTESSAVSEANEPGINPVTVLLLEEDEELAGLVEAQLADSDINYTVRRAKSFREFSAACDDRGFDIVIAQFRLPAWECKRALSMSRLYRANVPFVFLSHVDGEDHAVDCLQEGADGYVHCRKLEQLPSALARAFEYRSRAANRGGEHEHIFRQISEHTRDIICLHAPDRAVTFVSPSVRTLLGYQPQEWMGARPIQFLHPHDRDQALMDADRAIDGGDPRGRFTARFKHRDGHFVWLEVIVEPIRNDAGELAEIISISRDFTERHEAEETMRRGEKLFAGIAEANRLLLTTSSVRESYRQILKALGEATFSDRVVIFELQFAEDGGHAVAGLRAEWVSKPAYSLFSDPRLLEIRLDLIDAGEIPHHFSAGEDVFIDIETAPPEIRKSLKELGILSMIAFPIIVGGNIWGGMAFHQCERSSDWLPAERSALGAVASTLGQVMDREKALAALAASESQYEALLESLSEGVFQIDLAARWRFLNPTWEDLSGYTAEECIGRRFSEFLRESDAAESLQGFGRLVSGGETRVETELCFIHKDGSERWLRVIARPQDGPDGRITGVAGTLVDVTQRRRAQDALEASERKFASVFASASDALFLVSRTSRRIVECNPRAVEMFECDTMYQLVGTRGNFLHKDQLPGEEIEGVYSLIASGGAWSREIEYETMKGRAFWGQVAVSRMEPESLGTMLVRITDITELKESESRLRSSLGEKEVLLKEVYHRVKNNLQIISALLRMQTRRVKDYAAIEALEHSIGRVMAMSMVHEKLYQAQNLVSIDFISFAQSLVGFLNQLTVGSQSEVAIDVTGEELALSIDQAIPLGLVLNELVTNSIKYAFPEGSSGRVRIDVRRSESGEASVVVADNGVGFPSGMDPESSSGLGFRIVRMLVEQLHGGLNFESQDGLKVTVLVPLKVRHAIGAVTT